MRFWTPKLNPLHKLLVQMYPEKTGTYFIVESVGLARENIAFSDRAVDNWYNIILQASIEGKLVPLFKFVAQQSRSPTFNEALEAYLKTPDWLGGGDPVFERALKVIVDVLKQRWRTALAVLGGVILLVGGVVTYYFMQPVTIAGYISCDGSSARRGERLEAATVIIPGTDYKAVTDAQGHFSMSVPRSLKFSLVEVLYAFDRVQISRNQLENPDHQVVPCHRETPPKLTNIQFQLWKETPLNEAVIACTAPPEIRQLKLYTLKPSEPIQKTNAAATDLYVNAILLGGWKFINAEVTLPRADPEPWAETVVGEDRRQWFFDMPDNQLEIGIQICFGTESDGSRFSDTALVSNYYLR